MKTKKTLRQEYIDLMEIHGGHEIAIIFNGLKGYQEVRTYTTLAEIKKEINKLTRP